MHKERLPACDKGYGEFVKAINSIYSNNGISQFSYTIRIHFCHHRQMSKRLFIIIKYVAKPLSQLNKTTALKMLLNSTLKACNLIKLLPHLSWHLSWVQLAVRGNRTDTTHADRTNKPLNILIDRKCKGEVKLCQ